MFSRFLFEKIEANQASAVCKKCQKTLDDTEIRSPCKSCGYYNDKITCPRCYKYILFSGEKPTALPYPGARIQCPSCTTEFQMVHCPKCKTGNYWQKSILLGFTFRLGYSNKCFHCQTSFKVLICPYCLKEDFPENFDESKPVECKDCKKSYFLSVCPLCAGSNFSEKFKYFKTCSCCSKTYSRISCPGCNFKKNILEASEIGRLNDCENCNNRSKHVLCPFCDSLHEMKLNQINDLCEKITCDNCKQSFKTYNCPECSGSSNCKCDPNAEHTKESNNCSLCLKTYRTDEDRNKDYQCKICYSEFIDGIFEKCTHACCCFKCFSKLPSANCPICRERSPFKRFKLN
jgi:hypothetical protein